MCLHNVVVTNNSKSLELFNNLEKDSTEVIDLDGNGEEDTGELTEKSPNTRG